MSKAKWFTKPRRNCLIRLFVDSGGSCVFGHENCTIPNHHYELYIERLIRDWISADKSDIMADWLNERVAMHKLNERTFPIDGQFNAVSRDIYHDSQPAYYVEAFGLDAVRRKPFVKVKLASSYMRIHVDLGDTLKHLSKNKRRKILRYEHGGLPVGVEKQVLEIVDKAVKHYLGY